MAKHHHEFSYWLLDGHPEAPTPPPPLPISHSSASHCRDDIFARLSYCMGWLSTEQQDSIVLMSSAAEPAGSCIGLIQAAASLVLHQSKRLTKIEAFCIEVQAAALEIRGGLGSPVAVAVLRVHTGDCGVDVAGWDQMLPGLPGIPTSKAAAARIPGSFLDVHAPDICARNAVLSLQAAALVRYHSGLDCSKCLKPLLASALVTQENDGDAP